MRWHTRMGRRIWFHEVTDFLLRDKRVSDGPTLRQFWGAPQDAEEVPVRIARARRVRMFPGQAISRPPPLS